VSGQIHVFAALSPGKSAWYPLERRLGGPYSWSGRYGGVKILDPTGTLSLTCQLSSLRPVTSPLPLVGEKICRHLNGIVKGSLMLKLKNIKLVSQSLSRFSAKFKYSCICVTFGMCVLDMNVT
jgi:hypothetical protein